MKNKLTNRFLPITVAWEQTRNRRHIKLPIRISIGDNLHYHLNIDFIMSNYMLLTVVALLSVIALYGTWGETQSTYIKNLWVQVGVETPFSFWSENSEKEQLLASASVLNLRGESSPTMELAKLTASKPQNTKTTDTKNGLPIFVHAVADYDNLANLTQSENAMEEFMIQKQIRITKALIQNKASRLDQLPDSVLLDMNKDISRMFISMVLQSLNAPAHVWNYFTDTVHLRKIETALMEQIKYNVPVSIKLAQSALETAYGSRVIHNNYFGIKDKNRTRNQTITTEYFTAEEASMNQDIILTQKPFIKNGQVLYECKVQDYFTEYKSAWESFRGHSEFLANNKRYAPLFTKGKKYEDWADKIGSERTGGVGYATSPLYGELLKKIIKRYCLHLLDH